MAHSEAQVHKIFTRLSFNRNHLSLTVTMASETAVAPKRKLRPARKQVAPGEIDKSEGPQPGKEYSESGFPSSSTAINFGTAFAD